jgi:hypothetical protein
MKAWILVAFVLGEVGVILTHPEESKQMVRGTTNACWTHVVPIIEKVLPRPTRYQW